MRSGSPTKKKSKTGAPKTGVPLKLRRIIAERAREMRKYDEEREYYDSISMDQINEKLLFLKNAIAEEDSDDNVRSQIVLSKMGAKAPMEAKYQHAMSTPSDRPPNL